MNIDEDTSAWLGCPTPLEMYKHQCALLEDELTQTQAMLRKARANVAGLVQMNDALLMGKARAEKSLREALDKFEAIPHETSNKTPFQTLEVITRQRDDFFRENQRLLLELRVLKGPQP